MALSKNYRFTSERLDIQRDEQPILLLTNNSNTNPFYEWLNDRESLVARSGEVVDSAVLDLRPRFVVSFNYRHILSQETIESLGCPIVNIHCSVLPWNRGASPNFFSYYENTPKGVTVHELIAGLDKGGVLLQRILPLGEDETFESSYEKLIGCACRLLEENWDLLIKGRIEPEPQPGGGSYHSMADFSAVKERFPFEWSERICDWKKRFGLE